jgi:hypothetical protein
VRWVKLMTLRDWNATREHHQNLRASRIAIRCEERPSLDGPVLEIRYYPLADTQRVVTKNDPGLTVGWSEKGVSNNADSRESTTRASRVPRRHCSPRACPRTTATHTSECHVSEPLAGGALAGQGRRAFRRVPERPRFRKLAALGRSPPDNYGHSERYGNDEYRARGSARYASAESEVRLRVARKPPRGQDRTIRAPLVLVRRGIAPPRRRVPREM